MGSIAGRDRAIRRQERLLEAPTKLYPAPLQKSNYGFVAVQASLVCRLVLTGGKNAPGSGRRNRRRHGKGLPSGLIYGTNVEAVWT